MGLGFRDILGRFLVVLALGFPAFSHACPNKLLYAAMMDPYSSSMHVLPELRKNGMGALAVVGYPNVPEFYTFNPQDWDDVIVYSGPESTAAAILAKGYKIGAFLDGAETGTVKASFTRDALRSAGVPLLGNTSDLAWARRDKVELAKLLGDLAPRYYAATTLEEALSGARHLGYPVIVKPNRNAGGSNVKKCHTPMEVTKAFHNIDISGTNNGMQEADTAVLIQEPMVGQERAFNGVRDSAGNVIFTGVWKYSRESRNGSSVYLADRLIDLQAEDLGALLDRIEEALRRTGHVGPFHIEMINDKIIDFGARLSGGGLPLMELHGTDRNPFQLALKVGLKYDALAGMPRLYTLRGSVATVHIATEGGFTASHRLKDTLESMKRTGTVVDYYFSFPEGTPLKPSIDADTMVAEVLLKTDSVQEREDLTAKVLEWRDQGYFENR